jgi:hypothetical protein
MNECQQCGAEGIHFSSGFDASICLTCGWVAGEPYEFRPRALPWKLWSFIVSHIYRATASGYIDRETYWHMLEEMSIQ